MLSLQTPISEIKGVGQATTKKLKKLGIETVKDLLYHFPFKYEDYTYTAPIAEVVAGQNTNIQGTIELIQNKKSAKKGLNITEALISDDTGNIKVIWFNQPFIIRNLKSGQKVSLSGKTEENYGATILNSPAYEKMTGKELIHTKGIIPHYHLTEGVTNKQIRHLISKILPVTSTITDWLPLSVKNSLSLQDLGGALYKLHSPQERQDIHLGRTRLAFDELFLLHLRSQLIKKDIQSKQAVPVPFQEEKTREFVQKLPFDLTNAQRKSAWEILQDMGREYPMARLLEGDVGSGKTVVAAIAMLNVALNSDKEKETIHQSVLMAPTEVLAQQHFHSLTYLLSSFSVSIALFTGSKKTLYTQEGEEKNITKKELLNAIEQGNIDMVIGTHTLIQEDISFYNLVLAIVDEQHRFGVEQRKALVNKSKGENTIPHLLSMTATPIPRSLALALFSDLDISIIDELPRGRRPISTEIIPPEKKENTYKLVKEKVLEGRQAFVICPLIEASPEKEIKSVEQEYQKMNEEIFPDLNIGILHGKLKPQKKEKVMRDFWKGKYHILISTSVVEVGVDIPNATIMIIEEANRFGLSQLHQFRGRVGRGEHRSYCFLFTEDREGSSPERLQALVETQDGFALAKKDLELRGSGDLYGTAQKGFPQFQMASLFDHELMKTAQQKARELVEEDPTLEHHPALKYIIEKDKERVHKE